jgi:hypothetical protein
VPARLVAVVVAATLLPSATAATLAQPYNGRLAFATLGSVVLVTPDGTGMWRVDTAWVDSWSPDGERLLVDSENHLFAVDPDGGRRTRLTSSPAYDGGAEYSPDGNSIAFESNRDGPMRIRVMNADGTGAHRKEIAVFRAR